MFRVVAFFLECFGTLCHSLDLGTHPGGCGDLQVILQALGSSLKSTQDDPQLLSLQCFPPSLLHKDSHILHTPADFLLDSPNAILPDTITKAGGQPSQYPPPGMHWVQSLMQSTAHFPILRHLCPENKKHIWKKSMTL